MVNISLGIIITFLMMVILYLGSAWELHNKCAQPGTDCVQVPEVIARLFWGQRHDRLRNPLGIFLQTGAIVGAMLVIADTFVPSENPCKKLLLLAQGTAPFVVMAIMNVIYKVIRRFR